MSERIQEEMKKLDWNTMPKGTAKEVAKTIGEAAAKALDQIPGDPKKEGNVADGIKKIREGRDQLIKALE